ncbi:MAG: hypothetical protein KW806_01410 [Candidatus Yanofskybacteria bacterium]|nr:hypothetical protein [Candidatus Yanofskybacteria bacterium]
MSDVLDLRKEPSSPEPELDVPETDHQDTLLSWEAAAHSDSAGRNSIVAGLVSLIAGVGALVITKDWTLTTLLGLSGTLFLAQSKSRPPLKLGVSEQGIHVNQKTYFYRNLASFWIEYHPGDLKELSVGLHHWYLPHLKLPLGNQSPLAVRQALVNFLPEREHPPSLLDGIIKRIF